MTRAELALVEAVDRFDTVARVVGKSQDWRLERMAEMKLEAKNGRISIIDILEREQKALLK